MEWKAKGIASPEFLRKKDLVGKNERPTVGTAGLKKKSAKLLCL
jgi:hypothetical protein